MTGHWEPESNDTFNQEITASEKSLTCLVRQTVGRELDRQRGKASAEFSRMVQAEKLKLHIGRGNHVPPGAAELRRFKMWAGAASGLAACLALVVGLQVWSNGNRAATTSDDDVISGSVPVMDQVVYTRDLDGGTVLGSDGPMRLVRKQTVRKTQWFDPREKATYSITEPVERVGYLPLQPY